MSFVERVNQGESLASWLNEPPVIIASCVRWVEDVVQVSKAQYFYIKFSNRFEI